MLEVPNNTVKIEPQERGSMTIHGTPRTWRLRQGIRDAACWHMIRDSDDGSVLIARGLQHISKCFQDFHFHSQFLHETNSALYYCLACSPHCSLAFFLGYPSITQINSVHRAAAHGKKRPGAMRRVYLKQCP